ncbi:PREDICTED: serine/threonine-protein kinase RIO2-like, partial [Rhagoletis zephyria]|uniref:serine/threonine-protein kinase RIO2-like n=1 Tax=Rhagoletis zephyria TaxID=28612 RepID=UPI00081170BA
MVKLDASQLRYLTRDHFRALTAVEMGMRNHELVPRALVYSISGINNGSSINSVLLYLCDKKLLTFERGKRYDGYRLTYSGYDFLALNVLRARGVISSIGNQIGVGKESDVYVASNDEGRLFAVKLHRLGRTCFRKVSEKRDYQRKGASHKAASWIYLSRLAAIREYAFMKLLHERQLLPIPEPVDYNRHAIVMELIDGRLLNHISREDLVGEDGNEEKIEQLYEKLMAIIMKLANEFGVVHGDFNEFNILLRNNEGRDPVMIDFPQMVSVGHELGPTYFERDVGCIVDFFVKRFNFESDSAPAFEALEISESTSELKQLADLLDDEATLLQHIEKEKGGGGDGGKSETLQEEEVQQQQTLAEPQDMLSKFLNSLPSSSNHNTNSTDKTGKIEESSPPLYYEQMNDALIAEAQEKLLLEGGKLAELTLSREAEERDTFPEDH